MNCEENAIKIYRGDDTDWNGETLLHFKVTSTVETVDLSTMTASFTLGSITKTNIPLDEGGEFDVNYSHAETSTLPWGPNKGILRIYDSEKRIKTASNSVLFFVTSEPVAEQGETINVPVAENSPFQIDVVVGDGGIYWGKIEGDIQDQEDLQAEFNTKMDKSGGTFTGDVTLAQGVSLKTQVGQIHDVNDNIVIGGKNTNYGLYVSPDGTAAALVSQNSLKDIVTSADVKSTYSASGTDPVNGQAVAQALETKQNTIPDLEDIRNGAALGATAVQPATMTAALATKQDKLNNTQMQAVDSGANSTNIAQIASNTGAISTINSKIPNQASSTNQLADKEFVNSSISTNTANFIGTFENLVSLEAYSGTVTNNDYAFVVNGVITNNGDDWATFAELDAYNKALLTNFDYAWVVNGSKFDLYRFDIILQAWDLRASNIYKTDVSLNTAYNRYKASVLNNVVTWGYEYTLNNSSFTAGQWAAINSGATAENIAQIAANTTAIAGKQDIIGDLASIRSGAALGDTAIQPGDDVSALNNDANYVTDTDYATTTTGGVVKVSTNGGTAMNASGVITTYRASDDDIDGKTNAYRVIVPQNLDYAVKMGITDNANTLTDAEKAAAQDWLGVDRTEPWLKPSEWIDIRSGALPNSVYFLVGHAADYSSYSSFVFKATISNSGSYDVYVDGIKQATTANNTDTTLNWQTLALTSGWDVTYPSAMRTHIVRVTPSVSTNKITGVYYTGDSDGAALWIHNTVEGTFALGWLSGRANAGHLVLLEAITTVGEQLATSGSNQAFAECAALKELPALDFTSNAADLYRTFLNCTSIKKIKLQNLKGNGTTSCFNGCTSLEEIKAQNSYIKWGTSMFEGCAKLKSLGELQISYSDNSTTKSLTGCVGLSELFLDMSNNASMTRLAFGGGSNKRIDGLKGLTVSPDAPFSGNSPQLDVSYTGLSRSALVNLFNSMPTVTDSQVCNIKGATGAEDLDNTDIAIAQAKGWTVTR